MILERIDKNIWRGSRPESWRDICTLADHKVSTILNLESGFYERLAAHRNQETLRAIHRGLNPIQIRMSNVLSPTRSELISCVRVMKLDMVFVHCRWGVDRTGMAVAAYRILTEAWDYDKAVDEMLAHGFHKFPYGFWIKTLRELEVKW